MGRSQFDSDIDILLEQLHTQESELASLPPPARQPMNRAFAPVHFEPPAPVTGFRRMKFVRDMDKEEKEQYLREQDDARGNPDFGQNVLARRAALEMNIESLKDQIGRLVAAQKEEGD